MWSCIVCSNYERGRLRSVPHLYPECSTGSDAHILKTALWSYVSREDDRPTSQGHLSRKARGTGADLHRAQPLTFRFCRLFTRFYL